MILIAFISITLARFLQKAIAVEQPTAVPTEVIISPEMVEVIRVKALEEMVEKNVYGHGHNTYYFFIADMDTFLDVLDYFRDIHTNLVLVCVEPNIVRHNRTFYDIEEADYGATVGHTVFFRENN